MAKGKKSSGTTYVSKGEVGRPMKTPEKDPVRKMINKLDAWRRGKKVVLSVQDPMRRDGAHMKVTGFDYWGDPNGKSE
jgi:hypothetical protein